jgi:hypothetical protein
MRIDQTSGPAALAGGSRTRRRQPGFSVGPEDEASGAAAPATTSGAPSVGLVVLAEAGEPAPESMSDQVAAGHGGAVLKAMAGLQLALLEGGDDEARRQLAALLKGLPTAADPALDEVLQAIGQRAAVELARSE